MKSYSVNLGERTRRMRAWLLPATCTLCARTMPPERDFCGDCEPALPLLGPSCVRCAAPLPIHDASGASCGQCLQTPPAYATARAAFRYETPVDRLVHGAKYAARLDWAALLGRQVAKHFAPYAASIDALVAVPLHGSRLRERGYNQSLELARPLAKRLNIPLLDVVARVRATPPQTALSREERSKNMRRAFAVTGDVSQKNIAVVDDVMTSGATAEAMAKCLLKAGASNVEIWVVARA